MNGPSVTLTFPPSTRTRFPFELGCSPSVASSTPALVISSMNVPIFSISSLVGGVPASESLSALSSPMKRMVGLLLLSGPRTRRVELLLPGCPGEVGDLSPRRPVQLRHLVRQDRKGLAQGSLWMLGGTDVADQRFEHSLEIAH